MCLVFLFGLFVCEFKQFILRFELFIFHGKLLVFFPQLFLEEFNIIIGYVVKYNLLGIRCVDLLLLVTTRGTKFLRCGITVVNRFVTNVVATVIKIVINVGTNVVASGIR